MTSSEFCQRLEVYRSDPPSAQGLVDLFAGQWSSRFPPELAIHNAGNAPLYRDQRIHWLIQELGGVAGMTALELGPLEGMHSYLMERSGVAHLTAIEANPKAFLRCLVVKELLNLCKCHFLFGDFMPYLSESRDHYDLVLASGVLYHQTQPWEMMARVSEKTDRLLLWTHYFDEEIFQKREDMDSRFSGVDEYQFGSVSIRRAKHHYGERTPEGNPSFCGGPVAYSYWMTLDSIFALLQRFGFQEVRQGFTEPDHPNGPATCLLALR